MLPFVAPWGPLLTIVTPSWPLLQKLCQNIWKQFREEKIELGDWAVTEEAMKAVLSSCQQWISKHVSGRCGVNKWMKRWNKSDTSKCPCCEAPIKDTIHVWKCLHKEAQQIWQKGMDTLKIWMWKNKMDPQLIIVLVEGLTCWHKDTPYTIPSSTTTSFEEAAQQQQQIGWGALLEGCPAIGWAAIQQHYYTWINSQLPGKRWLSAFIYRLWDIAWSLWDHQNKINNHKEMGTSNISINLKVHKQFQLGQQGLMADVLPLFHKGFVSQRGNTGVKLTLRSPSSLASMDNSFPGKI